MAIVLEANYSKKLGLPGYSSHQYMVTVRTELADLSQVPTESARLYALLQSSVDRELQNPGFVPANGNGKNGGNGYSNGHHAQQSLQGRQVRPANVNGNGSRDQWSCSPKQKDYILDLIREHALEKNNIEALAQDRFGKPVRQLNKLEASGLIEEIKEQVAGQSQPQPARTQ
jgi:hypothetical protein